MIWLPSLLALVYMPRGALAPYDLRCEYTREPLGIDTPHPRLSWKLRSPERGDRQTAWQVHVVDASGGALWDSGRVANARQLGIEYGGRALRSGQRVRWNVTVWDRNGRPSATVGSWWEMGLVGPGAWQAKWIEAGWPPPARDEDAYGDRPAPLFRREFTARGRVARARAYVSGLGYYELTCNGRRVGDRLLDPAWTDYAHRVYYSTYDVTRLLRPGRNALGIQVGNGWYNPLPLRIFGIDLRRVLTTGPPRAILQLAIDYADGSRETVITDERWRVGESPIRNNSLYLGEVYDARREHPGWDMPGFDDSAWTPAVAARGSVGPLQAEPLPPVRATRTVTAQRVTQPKPGVFIVDMGRNFAGVVSLALRGAPGKRIVLRYGELLYPDGTLNVMTSVAGQVKYRNGGPGAPPVAWQTDTYVCHGTRGGGAERWTPRFTWHGFRYVEITGADSVSLNPTRNAAAGANNGRCGALPACRLSDRLGRDAGTTVLSVTGHAMNSDVEAVGSFECSSPLFGRIQEMVRWTLLSNLFSVESDCPHRERLGYGGDMVAACETEILNFDMERFYAKAVQDFADDVRPNGGFTETAPFVGIADQGLGERSGPVGWGTAFPVLQWQLYRYYGDRRILAAHYGEIGRWIALLQSRAANGILDNGISDHESLVPKPVALTGTAFYYLNVRTAADIAAVLGHTEDARRYVALASQVRDAFNRRFLHADSGRYDTGTQACQAFALALRLAPESMKQKTLKALVDDVLAGHGGHLTTGIFGTKYMLEALTWLGRADVAYTIASQRTFPGWGWMLANGATTLWEHWAYEDRVYSHDHPMFGSVGEWFYTGVAGIRVAPSAVGCDRVVLEPGVVGDLTHASATYDGIRGPIVSRWRRTGRRLEWTVEVPPGVTAEVHVPTSDRARVRESGLPVQAAPGVVFLSARAGSCAYGIAAGRYRFTSRL